MLISEERFNQIITEAIESLVNEIKRDSMDPWSSFEKQKTTIRRNNGDILRFRDATDDKKAIDAVINRPKKQPTKRPRKVMGISTSMTPNQLGRSIKASFYCKEIESIASFGRHYSVFGVPNADKFFEFYKGEDGKNLFIKYSKTYRDVMNKMNDIIEWGKQGDRSVFSRAVEMSVSLNELANIIIELSDKTRYLMKYPPFLELRKAGNKGNIIDGYPTVLGLKQLVIAKGQKPVSKVVNKLREAAQSLESFSNMEHPTTIARRKRNTV